MISNPWKGLKGLPAGMWVVAFAILINRMGTMVIPFLAIYLTTKIGLKPGTAGSVITFYGLGALITAPFVGRLSDRIGALRLMKISLLLSGLMLFIYPQFTSYYSILAVTFIWAAIGEAFRPASLSLTSALVVPEKRKTAFSLMRQMINLGMSIGPVIGGFLIQYNYHLIFYIDGLTSVAACLFLVFIPVKLHKTSEASVHHERVNPLKDRTFTYFLISILPAMMVIFQFFGAMPLALSADLGFSTSTIGMLLAINTIMIIFLEIPLSSATSAWKHKTALCIGAILLASGFGAMAFAGGVFTIALTIIIWTFGEMILFPASNAFVSEIAPEMRRGEYMGFYQMVFSLAWAFGPWMGTKIFEQYGSTVLWLFTFVLGAVSAVMVLFIREIRKRDRNSDISEVPVL